MDMHSDVSTPSKDSSGKFAFVSRIANSAKDSISTLPSIRSTQGMKVYALPIALLAVGGYFLFKKFRAGRGLSDLDLMGDVGLDSSARSNSAAV